MTDDIESIEPEKRRRAPHETQRPATVALVLSPYEPGKRGLAERDSDAKLEEAMGLARAIDLDVRDGQSVPLRRVTPATLIGKGTVERIKSAVEALSPTEAAAAPAAKPAPAATPKPDGPKA